MIPPGKQAKGSSDGVWPKRFRDRRGWRRRTSYGNVCLSVSMKMLASLMTQLANPCCVQGYLAVFPDRTGRLSRRARQTIAGWKKYTETLLGREGTV